MLVHGMNMAEFPWLTNFGEVLGSSIGPGSNSHYFIKEVYNDVNIGVAEIIIMIMIFSKHFQVQMIIDVIGKTLIFI